MAFFNAEAKPNPRHLPASGGRESTMNQAMFFGQSGFTKPFI